MVFDGLHSDHHAPCSIRFSAPAVDLENHLVVTEHDALQRIEHHLQRVVEVETLHGVIPANRVFRCALGPVLRALRIKHVAHGYAAWNRSLDTGLSRQIADGLLVVLRLFGKRRHRCFEALRHEGAPIAIRANRPRKGQFDSAHIAPWKKCLNAILPSTSSADFRCFSIAMRCAFTLLEACFSAAVRAFGL
jgi:hypothetical protein